MNKLLLITSLVVLSSCASNDTQNTAPQQASKGANTAFIKKAKAHVSGLLVNPDSAKFKNIVQKAPNLVCGEVDGKNKDGEYTQFTPFYYQEKNGKVSARIASEDRLNRVLFNSMYRALCK